MMPKFSVIINCYNGSKFLDNAIRSILAQTYKDFEIVFYDNASTDNSVDLAKKYGDRIKCIQREVNVPLGQARYEATKHCNGEWICFLDVDDEWLDIKLERQIELINFYPSAILLYGGIEEISVNGDHLRFDVPRHNGQVKFSDLLLDYDINIVTAVINNSFLIDNNLNFDNRIQASEEYNLFMRCAVVGQVVATKQVLGKYRVYENSLTNKAIDRWHFERSLTMGQCLQLDVLLIEKYPIEFRSAISRSIYYNARFLFSENKLKPAREAMSYIKYDGVLYFCLYLIAFFPLCWRFVHLKKNKSKLTSLIRGITSR